MNYHQNKQKKDWPKHKELCKTFQVIMDRAKKLDFDDFPFRFYNKNDGQVLYDYNQVNLLEHNGFHNSGIYRRLCHCFGKLPYGMHALFPHLHPSIHTIGVLTVEMEFEAEKAGKDDSAVARVLGVDPSFLPVEKPLKGDFRSISTWADYYTKRGIPLHSPLALVLDYPLTIFYLLKERLLPKYGGIPMLI